MSTLGAYSFASANGIIMNYVHGLYISNNVTTTLLNINSGSASDSTNVITMTLANDITKSISTGFTAGTGNGGLGSGSSPVNATWYHVFLIHNISTSVSDVYFDTSATANNIPTGYTFYRRLGSIYYTTATQITKFTQYNRTLFIRDDMFSLTTTLNSTATLILSGAPLGIKTLARILTRTQASNTQDSGICVYQSRHGVLTYASAILLFPFQYGGTNNIRAHYVIMFDVESDTSGQVYYVTFNGSSLLVYNNGWIDYLLQMGS